jgi:peptidoglycan hydrolase CwlO-like protein
MPTGLQFRKVDLHVHTPASKCFKDKSITAQDIVHYAINKAGLSAIAITDHNTAQWIDDVKEAAKGTSLTVFPGVEISLSEGYHVLAIFDVDKSRADVENFLGSIDITANDYGRQDALCTKSAYDVINKISERHGLAILPHIDAPRGAFQELVKKKPEGGVGVPQLCVKLFNEARYKAVECYSDALPDGFDKAHGFRKLPSFYHASDNPDPNDPTKHALDGIGTRYSYFKLEEESNLEGLRQCFADAEVRIRLEKELAESAFPRIVSMSISGEGFLGEQELEFHPGLNSIIGGKGVGKSLAVEFLRFGLGQPSQDKTLQDDHESKLRKRLLPLNQVELICELENGTRYQICRTYDGAANPYECVNLTTGQSYEGDVPSLFPILAYSQTEVIKIAEDEEAQLRLVDSLIDPRPFVARIDELSRHLIENDRALAKAIEAREELFEHQKDLQTVTEQLENINRSLDAPLFEEMKSLELKKATFERQMAFLDDLGARVEKWLKEIEEEASLTDVESVLADDVDLVASQEVVKKARQSVLTGLKKLGQDIGKQRADVQRMIDAWLPGFENKRREYEKILENLGGDKKALEAKRRKLQKQQNDAKKKVGDCEEAANKFNQLRAERNTLLADLDNAYQGYFELRKGKFDDLTRKSDRRLKLELTHLTNRQGFLDELRRLSGSRGSRAVHFEAIAENLTPRQFIDLVVERRVDELMENTGLIKQNVTRIVEKLWGAEELEDVLRMQHAFYPKDSPSIKFRKEDGEYYPLKELSVGQKCSALLIIALSDGTMPVIIDQPEDALDIASVWEDITLKLRAGKESRQFILTTHNSSVAVASDSDKFVIIKGGAERGRVLCSGAIDREEVKREVIKHLEGGPDPYKLRQRKYNIAEE